MYLVEIRHKIWFYSGLEIDLELELLVSSLLFTYRLSPDEDGGDHGSEGAQKERSGCCHGGLPWWFVFFGWLLVVATSVVAGYFTMLYGLKFGKTRSISWLISMVVSFFQSILIIQPLKVRTSHVYFQLVV